MKTLCAALIVAATVALAASGPIGPATRLESVKAKHAGGKTTVTLSADGELTPSSVTEIAEKPRRLVLDFPNVSSRGATQFVEGPLVERVRIALNSREPMVTRVVLEIHDRATYHVERGPDAGRELAVIFENAPATAKVMLTSAPAVPVEPEPTMSVQQALANGARLAPPPEPTTAPVSKPSGPLVLSNKPQTATPPTPPQLPLTPAPSPQQPVTVPAQPQQPIVMNPSSEKKYIGVPVSLDFPGADLRSVLRALISMGGLNVVFDDAVQGTIDIVVNDIPWDQAMETILRSKKLSYVAEGTIIRIAPVSVLAEEEAERRKLSEARALAGDLRVQTFSLSYARAAELQPLLTQSALSSRGQIQVDARTNTLIITDLPDRLQIASNLINGLDRPEPQVEVEARIVQTTRDFARAIGIQWGLNGRMTPDIGNTTNLAFPNRGTLGGRTGTANVPTDPRATETDATGTVVNLPVAGATSAIGLALGAVNGAFNLDVALSALERSGKGRVLSTPRLTTQNNVAAEVGQGVQIPIQVVSNNTVTVTFKEALLLLKVTPQITAAGTVIMQVSVENASADFSRVVNGIPPIDTQRAVTQVQVNDGATTVIGGIFVSREQSATDKTPVLSRIPLLGWLFRRDSVQDESRELLIFITPRIIKG